MKTTTIACAIAAAIVASLCLPPGLAPEAWAQTKPAAVASIDTAPEATAPLAVTARGAWSPSVNYVKDDLVTSRGSAWRAKRANINKVPGSTSPSTALDWERFAAGFNPLGAWLSTTMYHRDDLVLRLGSTWRARRTNLNMAPGLSPPDWQQFAAQGAPGGNSVGNGSAGAPSINFASDPDTGIFSPGIGKIAMSAGGALFLHNIGSNNTALGVGALDSSTNFSDSNTAVGTNALTANTDGMFNTAVGANALASNTTGDSNTAFGNFALTSNTTGGTNVAIGRDSLRNNTAGGQNVAIGLNAGFFPTAPGNSIFIRNNGLAADTATIKIGTQGTQTTAFIAGIRGATTGAADAIPVLISSTGQLGTVSSSRRYKDDIQSMGDASSALLKLRPVTFRYTKPYDDGGKPIQYGLIAEEVAEVLPELAVFNKDGSPETVKYHLLPALLLNEYQGQQRTIERQEQTIRYQAEQAEQQQKTIQSQAEQMAALEQRLVSLEARLSGQGTLKAAYAAPMTR